MIRRSKEAESKSHRSRRAAAGLGSKKPRRVARTAKVATKQVRQKFDWETVINSAYESYNRSEYRESQALLMKWFKRIEQFGARDERLAYACRLLGLCLHQRGRYERAQAYLRRSAKIYSNRALSEKLWSMWWLADCYRQLSRLRNAARIYLKIAELSDEGEIASNTWCCRSLLEAADCYLQAGDQAVTEAMLVQAVNQAAKPATSVESAKAVSSFIISLIASSPKLEWKMSPYIKLARRSYTIARRKCLQLKKPVSKRVRHQDTYFGRRIRDDFQWLENKDSSEVQAWVVAQKDYARRYMDDTPGTDELRVLVDQLFAVKIPLVFFRIGDYIFYEDRYKTKWYRSKRRSKKPALILDNDTLPPHQTITEISISPNGELISYWVSEKGSDWQSIYTKNIATGRIYPGGLLKVRAASIVWAEDNKGFYYCAAFGFGDDACPRILYHKLRTLQSKDKLIYRHKEADEYLAVSSVLDHKYLLVSVHHRSRLKFTTFLLPIDSRSRKPIVLQREDKKQLGLLGESGTRLYFKTDRGAPLGRIVSLDATPKLLRSAHSQTPHALSWQRETSERAHPLKRAFVWGDEMFLLYMTPQGEKIECHDATNQTKIGEVMLPTGAAVTDLRFAQYPTVILIVEGYTTPFSIFLLNLKRASLKLDQSVESTVDLTKFVTETFQSRSKDGKLVPFHVRYKKGLRLNGRNATILSGYGGFDRSFMPHFNNYDLVWMEMGGVCVDAVLRGDGDMGSDWRMEGTRENKQKTFDDFIAVSRMLFEKKFTRPDKLGVKGYSNGGLLIGAMLTQQPQMFGAALIGAGLLDMLRYHKFNLERHFASEYGSANYKRFFPVLHKYSPLHQIRKRKYPSVLITTGSHDDRVNPAHSFKFAAALQQRQTGKAPIMLDVEMDTGHAGAKRSNRYIEELIFFGTELGLLPAQIRTRRGGN